MELETLLDGDEVQQAEYYHQGHDDDVGEADGEHQEDARINLSPSWGRRGHDWDDIP